MSCRKRMADSGDRPIVGLSIMRSLRVVTDSIYRIRSIG